MRFRISFLGCLVCLGGVAGPANSEDAKPIDFPRRVYPLLQCACLECHGADEQEGDLRLDEKKAAFESGYSGGVIIPGQPQQSELLRRVMLPRDDEEIMPARGEPLSSDEIELLRDWIRSGAEWPDDFEAGTHWSYVSPTRPPLPLAAGASWPRNAVDAFILARLQQQGLSPSRPADRETLIRRVHLDLLGVPPTPDEVDRFVADPGDDAYSRLVDQLLERPQFGERWARPWLDLARYADSHGFQKDNLRDVWAYRDWVIQALNTDMPFDRFTIEQIAGDLLPDAGETQHIATGFHRCTPTNVEAGSIPEETRIEQVMDRVNTTGAVWLGTTLECAQCHDHKYDPFSQKEYYQLLAFFNSTEAEADRSNPKVPGSIRFLGPSMELRNLQRESERKAIQLELAAVREKAKSHRASLKESLAKWSEGLADRLRDAPQTHVLEVVDFSSRGATDAWERLEDGSVLLVGDDPPDRDTYVISARTKLTEIRAIRLEVLTHDSLPGKGPGRGDAKRTNFVLNEFSLALIPPQGEAVAVAFSKARANFSQNKWAVAGAVDQKPETGWAIAPRFGESHWAVFETFQPLGQAQGIELRFKLIQNFGGARSIGRLRLLAVTGDLTGDEVPANIAELVRREPANWDNKDQAALLDYREQDDAGTQSLKKEIKLREDRLSALKPDTTLVMREMSEIRESTVFERGDYRNPGEVVRRGVPAMLHPLNASPPNRLALAHWLVDNNNPLVARVTVNRWWAELFGRGLVATIEDFGVKGDPPTHPQLLDWLAVEFMESGWSVKHLLRTMVSSAAYRQSSVVTPELLGVDDRNRWIARGPRFRMDAEMIRDNALAIGGLISWQQGGPPIRPWQPDGVWTKIGGTAYDYVVSPGGEQYRRGIYVVLKRGAPYPSFTNFDASARLACTVKRSRTNTPLQALTLLNDKVYIEAASGLARRILRDRPDMDLNGQLRYAFQICTSRQPDDLELAALQRLFIEQRRILADRAEREIQLADGRPGPPGAAKAELVAWYAVATVLLNLDETITKP